MLLVLSLAVTLCACGDSDKAQKDGAVSGLSLIHIWHSAGMKQEIGACGASGNDFQLSADRGLDAAGEIYELLHFFCRRTDRTVAAEICSDACQYQAVHFVFCLKACPEEFPAIPKALSQVAQIRHHDDVSADTLTKAFFIEGF